MLETTSAPGNPGATISLKNDGPAFNLPARSDRGKACSTKKGCHYYS